MRRRDVLAGVATAALTGCLGQQSGAGGDGRIRGSWPQRGVDARNSGYLDSAHGPRQKPSVWWSTDLDGAARAGPVVTHGRAFVPTAQSTVAVDTAGGDITWSKPAKSVPGATLAAASQRVLIPGADGSLRSRSPTDGAEQWTFDAGSPLVTAVKTTGPVAYVGTESGTLRAVDASGNERWRSSLGGEPVTAPAALGGVVYTGTAAGDLLGLEAGSGEVSWRASVGGRPGDPVVAGDLVLTTVGSTLLALDAETGQQIRNIETGTSILGSPAITDGARLLTGEDGVLRSLAPGGERNWTADVGAASVPVVAGDAVYVGTESGVAAVALTGGAVRWSVDLDAVVEYPVVTLDGAVVAVTGADSVVALTA
ncbi:PQQ-binding-like beta-propeller repeat protein [Haloarchaeobius sp. DFWS5]|uniref:outer membrane protein assembly factor BamB family protein n=1 Tax=Haloarchaeobius sp. DFWS5 TaxID=3446114 RepID=UPI003EBCC26A